MAYIGKITVSQTWTSVESLVKAQVEGQSSFAFDSSKNYFLQPEHAPLMRLCNASSIPTGEEGEWASDGDKIIYKKDSGTLYVKSDTASYLIIDELN